MSRHDYLRQWANFWRVLGHSIARAFRFGERHIPCEFQIGTRHWHFCQCGYLESAVPWEELNDDR